AIDGIEAIQTLEAWDASSLEEQMQIIAVIAGKLEPALRLLGWERHVLGDQAHTIALFAHGTRRLALLPGYVGDLGDDPARHQVPDHVEDAWRQHRDPRHATFADCLSFWHTPLRQVRLAPFLIETTAALVARRVPGPNNGWAMKVQHPPKHAVLLAEL